MWKWILVLVVVSAAILGELREQYRQVCCRTPLGSFNYELLHVVELESLLALSEIIARGALARQESRGSHFRLDYPVRNDSQWLKHTVATLDGSQIAISYKEVDVSLYEPKDRDFRPMIWSRNERCRCWRQSSGFKMNRMPRWPFATRAEAPFADRARCRSTASSIWLAAFS